ncbi:hypothetical protein IKI14_06560 [bacterium]|nr:hypothetical protein [bacterium]
MVNSSCGFFLAVTTNNLCHACFRSYNFSYAHETG